MDFLKTLLISLLFAPPLPAMAQDFSTTRNVKTEQIFSVEPATKYQIFYFWATWCPDCRDKLASDLSKYSNKTFTLSAISTDKDLEKIQDYLKQNSVQIPIFHDSEKKIQKHFKVFSVPTVVLVVKNGSQFDPLLTISGKDWSDLNSKIDQISKQEKDL